jgi:hypothetical protein
VASPRKRFAVAGGTLPSAEDIPGVNAPVRQDTQTDVRPEVVTPVRSDVQAPARTKPVTSAFTWRLTAEQSARMDDVVTMVKRQLRRPRVDRKDMLDALVSLAADNPTVFAALVARMAQQS